MRKTSDLPCSWIVSLHFVKHPPIYICRVHTLIKISALLIFYRILKNVNFIWKHKTPEIAKQSSIIKTLLEIFESLDFKLYYRYIIIKGTA